MMDSVFDTAILAVKMELINFLGEKGFGWFADFADVDCCMTESSVTINYKDKNIPKAVAEFAKTHKMFVAMHDTSLGRITIERLV